jgi:hypothetical protein
MLGPRIVRTRDQAVEELSYLSRLDPRGRSGPLFLRRCAISGSMHEAEVVDNEERDAEVADRLRSRLVRRSPRMPSAWSPSTRRAAQGEKAGVLRHKGLYPMDSAGMAGRIGRGGAGLTPSGIPPAECGRRRKSVQGRSRSRNHRDNDPATRTLLVSQRAALTRGRATRCLRGAEHTAAWERRRRRKAVSTPRVISVPSSVKASLSLGF